MTSLEAMDHVDAGEPCPQCKGTTYQVLQFVITTQKVYDGAWDSYTCHDDNPDVLEVTCDGCGHHLFNRSDQAYAAVEAALTGEGD
jgi:hypothetical protein